MLAVFKVLHIAFMWTRMSCRETNNSLYLNDLDKNSFVFDHVWSLYHVNSFLCSTCSQSKIDTVCTVEFPTLADLIWSSFTYMLTIWGGKLLVTYMLSVDLNVLIYLTWIWLRGLQWHCELKFLLVRPLWHVNLIVSREKGGPAFYF